MLHFILSELFGESKPRPRPEEVTKHETVAEVKNKEFIQHIIHIDNQSQGPLPASDNEEKSDNYSRTSVQLNDKWRVIVCKDGIQWILQKRKGSYNGRPAWRGRSYCRSKAGICRVIREHVKEVSPEADAQLAQLPDWVEP